jgi:hypothetical protein
VATAFAIDLARRRKIQPKVEEDSSDDLDGYVDDRGDPLWDPVDAKRMVGVFVEMLEAGELPNFSGEILQGNVAGWTDAHIGHELGLSGVTVAEHRRIVRRKFEKRLRELEKGDLIPRRRKEQDSGREAADTDDLPASVPTRR